MDVFLGLNQQQKEAVDHIDGPLLIVAGAGAGKTKTLTHRIVHLIQQGVSPNAILAITFTNKAAREMRERVELMISTQSIDHSSERLFNKPFISTFHALGVHILRESGHVIGLPKHFTILDQSDTLSLTKDAIKACDLDPKQFEPCKIHNVISAQKNALVSRSDFSTAAGNYFQEIVAEVWEKYEKMKKDQKSLDFDDLIERTVYLLQSSEKTRKYYQELWQYVHIDEYQDTNTVQYELSKLLADTHKNICVVGDTDQNIYSWRGADIKNMLRFEKDYPNAKTILLEENYRSTQRILDVANTVIKKNQYRVEKNLFTQKEEGEHIALFDAFNEEDEALFVASEAQKIISSGISPSNIAVLYRANFQSRVLESAFLKLNVPYQVLGVKFFERKEVKDLLSYIRAALNPDSLADIKRIINTPTRGIGKVTITKVFAGRKDELPARMKSSVDDFYKILSEIKAKSDAEKPSEVVKFAIKRSGLEKALLDGTDEDKERLENLKELVTLATKYDELPIEEGVEKLIADATLASDQDTLNKPVDAVKLMTVHAAKGLEFSHVFITGLEQDLFPHHKFDEALSKEAQEEERRLFYVALTRAEQKLYLSFAASRMIFGSQQVNVPSEFLADIDESHIEYAREGVDLFHDNDTNNDGKIVYLDL